MTPSTALKGLKPEDIITYARTELKRCRNEKDAYTLIGILITKLQELADNPYKGTLTDRELGSWRVSAKLILELADQTHEEVDWRGAFWELAWLVKRVGVQADRAIDLRRHTKLVPNGEHLRMKARDLLRLLDAVEGR